MHSDPIAPRRNIELKARLADLDAARRVAVSLCPAPPTTEQQTDTYFCTPRGRLKLREINDRASRLIAYARADDPAARPSDYRIVEVADATQLRAALAETLGIDIVVEKLREIFLYQNVRIHLDQVHGLGTFIEFEAVLPAAESAGAAESAALGGAAEAGERLLDDLSRRFGLSPADLVAASYSDLLRSINA